MQTIISHNVAARVRGPVNPLPRVPSVTTSREAHRAYGTEAVGPSTLSAHDSQTDQADSDPATDGKKKRKEKEKAHRQTPMRGRHPNSASSHMHIVRWKQRSTEPRRGDTLQPRVSKHTFVAAESRAGSGSARERLPDEKSLSRPPTELLIKHWYAKKE